MDASKQAENLQQENRQTKPDQTTKIAGQEVRIADQVIEDIFSNIQGGQPQPQVFARIIEEELESAGIEVGG